jgi:hypothetical protein
MDSAIEFETQFKLIDRKVCRQICEDQDRIDLKCVLTEASSMNVLSYSYICDDILPGVRIFEHPVQL